MSAEHCARLLDVYIRAAEALRQDDLDQAATLIDQADVLCAGIGPPDAGLAALVVQCDLARQDAAVALAEARVRATEAAQREFRAANAGRAYVTASDEQARFVDQHG